MKNKNQSYLLSSTSISKSFLFNKFFAKIVQLLNEKSLQLFSTFEEGRLSVIVIATVVKDFGHIFDEISKANISMIGYFRLDLFEICKGEQKKKGV